MRTLLEWRCSKDYGLTFLIIYSHSMCMHLCSDCSLFTLCLAVWHSICRHAFNIPIRIVMHFSFVFTSSTRRYDFLSRAKCIEPSNPEIWILSELSTTIHTYHFDSHSLKSRLSYQSFGRIQQKVS